MGSSRDGVRHSLSCVKIFAQCWKNPAPSPAVLYHWHITAWRSVVSEKSWSIRKENALGAYLQGETDPSGYVVSSEAARVSSALLCKTAWCRMAQGGAVTGEDASHHCCWGYVYLLNNTGKHMSRYWWMTNVGVQQPAGQSSGQDGGHSGVRRVGFTIGALGLFGCIHITITFAGIDNVHLPWTGAKIDANLCQSYWRAMGDAMGGRLSLGRWEPLRCPQCMQKREMKKKTTNLNQKNTLDNTTFTQMKHLYAHLILEM